VNEREVLVEIVLRALLDTSDSPFRRDDPDTRELAEEVADAIVGAGWPRSDLP
jgi:hypothetical protein